MLAPFLDAVLFDTLAEWANVGCQTTKIPQRNFAAVFFLSEQIHLFSQARQNSMAPTHFYRCKVFNIPW